MPSFRPLRIPSSGVPRNSQDIREMLGRYEPWPVNRLRASVRFHASNNLSERFADIVAYDRPADEPDSNPALVVEYVEGEDREKVARWWLGAGDFRIVCLLGEESSEKRPFVGGAGGGDVRCSERHDLPVPHEFEVLLDPSDISVETLLDAVRRGHLDYLPRLITEWILASDGSMLDETKGKDRHPEQARQIRSSWTSFGATGILPTATAGIMALVDSSSTKRSRLITRSRRRLHHRLGRSALRSCWTSSRRCSSSAAGGHGVDAYDLDVELDVALVMCSAPLTLQTMEIDHVIPQTLVDEPDLLAKVLAELGRPADFDVNSYENMLPACGPCNSAKPNIIWESSPLIHLHPQKAKVAEVEVLAAKTVSQRDIANALNTLERTHEDGEVTDDIIKAL